MGLSVLILATRRMRLVASTSELVRAEIHDRTEFARLLDAEVPSAWPTDEATDALPWFLERLEHADPSDIGWYGFYGVVATGVEDAPVLVGGGGCLGPPVDGSVEVGFSVLPAFQRQGYATEMMTAVLDWVRRDPRVLQITAETAIDNVPSRRLLSTLGFHEAGPGREPDSLKYIRTGTASRPIRRAVVSDGS
jgi:RimJ/RimL family protein N-acetyltransferase